MNKKVKFDASRLKAAIGGAGEPAVFVHGLASNRLIWRRVCHGLKDDFSYHAIDLPGSGESPAPRHFQYTIEHFADVVERVQSLVDERDRVTAGLRELGWFVPEQLL